MKGVKKKIYLLKFVRYATGLLHEKKMGKELGRSKILQ
jgi:hypothetical protein